jgi:D-glycero-D-manno-heptose 1,7-bisphosphate phosphatase
MIKKSKMKKAIFLDRDGVINKICYHHDLGIYSAKNLEEFKVIDKVKEAIIKLKKFGFKIIVITNQPGFEFGYLKEEDIEKINDYMKKELLVDAIYMCRHSPEAMCKCRKPKQGMFLQAAKENDIDFKKSYNIGDNISDMIAGKKCRKNIFIGNKRADLLSLFGENKITPDELVPNLFEAAKKIEQWEKKQ